MVKNLASFIPESTKECGSPCSPSATHCNLSIKLHQNSFMSFGLIQLTIIGWPKHDFPVRFVPYVYTKEQQSVTTTVHRGTRTWRILIKSVLALATETHNSHDFVYSLRQLLFIASCIVGVFPQNKTTAWSEIHSQCIQKSIRDFLSGLSNTNYC